MKKKEPKFVIPVKTFPYKEKCLYLTQNDKELISLNFDQLDKLCNYPDDNKKDKHAKLSHEDVEDIFLLLTTCRNRWYTLNAMYVEAVRWCQEGKDFKGFSDALDALRAGISSKKSLVAAANNASGILANTAEYLSEFLGKWNLYFQRFDEVHAKLSAYCESIPNVREKGWFRDRFVEYGNGPSPNDKLEPPSVEQSDAILKSLLAWFNVTRPLTSLARTYISEVLECGSQHDKTVYDYLIELQAGIQVWNESDYKCPTIPSREVYSWSIKSARPSDPPSEEERVLQFIDFCEKMCNVARRFLEDKLPGKNNLKERFPLKKPTEQELAIEKPEEQLNTNTLKLLSNDKKGNRIYLGGTHIHHEGEKSMKIGDIKNYGQINIADKIDKIVFKGDLGISKENLDDLKEGIKKLSEERQASLKEMFGELITCDVAEKKQSIIQKIKKFLEENGVPIAQSLTAGVILEIAKRLFGVG